MDTLSKQLVFSDKLALKLLSVWKNAPEKSPSAPKEVTLPRLESIPSDKMPLLLHLRPFNNGKLTEHGAAFVWADKTYFNVFALYQDSDPYSDATHKNDDTWRLGDVMELFIKSTSVKEYFENHVSPNGYTLELKVQDDVAFRRKAYTIDQLYHDSKINAAARPFKAEGFNGWISSICFPLSNLGKTDSVSGISFCVCRYNYNHGWEKPEVSTTAEGFNDTPCTFHNIKFWHVTK